MSEKPKALIEGNVSKVTLLSSFYHYSAGVSGLWDDVKRRTRYVQSIEIETELKKLATKLNLTIKRFNQNKIVPCPSVTPDDIKKVISYIQNIDFKKADMIDVLEAIIKMRKTIINNKMKLRTDGKKR